MTRAVVRRIVGLLLVLAGALALAPLMASPRSPIGRLIVARLPGQTGPTLTLPPFRTTTTRFTVASTSPPVSSSALTTPTTTTSGTTFPRRRTTVAASTTSSTSTSTTTTTVAPLPAVAPPPVTLPLASLAQSGNINPFFPILSGIGFFVLIVLLGVQWFLTAPGHRGPTL